MYVTSPSPFLPDITLLIPAGSTCAKCTDREGSDTKKKVVHSWHATPDLLLASAVAAKYLSTLQHSQSSPSSMVWPLLLLSYTPEVDELEMIDLINAALSFSPMPITTSHPPYGNSTSS
eukprot:CAMPEP_0113907484 /NCGR_PEP_ID=MMETSP0780_2-20120614/25513_1 /TAXON_ID=652834 /ORGANISM="Palpitomonas bilix" /LENGTH=118 /DNA_ID=CAMNT_0000902569 /DNA_START=14 /DNA_END=367 /DNA_ORIENTATION=- /assembly_acc=CAM_ASM_000599